MNNAIMERMLVPPRFWEVRFDQVQERCKPVLNKFFLRMPLYLSKGWGFLFWGACDGGKTSASVVVLKEALKHNKIGLFVSCRDVVRYVIEKTRFDDEQTMLERMETTELLVLDEFFFDVHKEEFFTSTIETLFRKRMMHNKSTIITTNFTLKQMMERCPSFMSVMTEVMFPMEFEFVGFRRKANKELEGELYG